MNTYTNNIPAGYKQKERLVYILFGVFFYGLGIHEFYRGNILGGLAYLYCLSLEIFWFLLCMEESSVSFIYPSLIQFGLFVAMLFSVIINERDANGILMRK